MPEKDAAVLSPIVADICFFIAQQAHASKQFDTAEYWYNNSLKILPENTEVHYALSYITANQRRFKEAVEHSTYALRGRHDAIAQYNRALCYLMLNDYTNGFSDYEARLRFKLNEESRIRRFGNLPYWKGEPCKILHVSGEQGFGDIFQFSRYLTLIKNKFDVEHIMFEVPQSCHDFFKYNFMDHPEIEVVTGHWHPQADYHIQLVSLAHVFKTTFETVPPILLEAEPSLISKHVNWTSKLKIAYCYQGRNDNVDMQVMEWNSRRSIDKDLFLSMFDPEKHYTVSLHPEENSYIQSWSDTAAIIANSDLVVGIDTGIIHLAAALGKPVFLLQHYHCCWRWCIEGDTPWYGNNLKQFRQKEEGNWSTVITEVKEKLNGYVKA
jgi:tetratricopeptide (TPR) repeat protein